jgi:glycosyltransferase involved in cell wall biosynthesis
MPSPRFSVVIPTRERADTLQHTLRTCLEQDFDDYEVIVCDNCSSPATRGVVEASRSQRVRYFRSDRPLAMSASWELAVSRARGEYVTVLGDDDGLMPYALRELDALARRHGSAAIHWHRGLYTWPTMAVAADANLLRLPLDRWVAEHDGRARIASAIRFETVPDTLPMIYNAVIRRDLIERHRLEAGPLFPNLYPDVYSGFAFAYLAGKYLSVGIPMNLAGLSGKSNGVSFLQIREENPIRAEFLRLHAEAGFAPHPTVPDLRLLPIHCADSFQFAKDRLFPNDNGLVLDRRAMAARYLGSITDADPAVRAAARLAIRDSLADRPDLIDWFDGLADPPPCAEFRMRGGQPMGFNGIDLHLDGTAFGLRTIHDAVRLAANMLGVGSGPIQYDLSSRAELVAGVISGNSATAAGLLARAAGLRSGEADLATRVATAEAALDEARARLARNEAALRQEQELRLAADRRLHAAERDGALRNVPRKLVKKVCAFFLSVAAA